MHTQLDPFPARSRRGVRHLVLSLPIALVLLAGAMTAATTTAAAATPQVSQPSTPAVVTVPASDLGPVLSTVPLSDLGLSEVQLSELLAKLNPELAADVQELKGVVQGLLESNPSATLGELTSKLTKEGGLLGSLLKELLPGLTPSQIVESLSPAQLTKLLENLAGGNPLGALTTGELTKLLEQLESKLSGEPAEALAGILKELSEGASLAPSTVGALSEHAGMAPETLAKDVGDSTKELPAATPALEGAVGSESPLVGVVKDAGGLAAVLLPHETPSSKGGETPSGGGNGGNGGSGGSAGSNGGGSGAGGGQGGQGGPGGTGTTTVVTVAPSAPVAAVKQSASKLAGVKILSHRVKRGVATIVVQVPAAGKLTVGGSGVKSSTSKPTGAKRVTVTIRLDKAGTASLHKHRNRLSVRLLASFKAAGGQSSSAAVTVSFG